MDQEINNRLIRCGIDPSALTKDEQLYLEAVEAYYADEAKVEPIMSDSQFDILEKRIKETNTPLVRFVGSKTRGTHHHPSPMLSLAKINVYDNENFGEKVENELSKFFNKVSHARFIESTLKYDGNAMNLVYVDGKLDQALTRTDKETGYDKKYKMQHIVPTVIPEKGIVEVRGEVVIPIETFEKYRKTKDNPNGSANERNYVAGVLGSDEVRINLVKELVFVAVEVRTHVGSEFNYSYDMHRIKDLLGFNQTDVPTTEIYSITDFKELYDKYLDYRENKSPYRLDGFVLKASNEVRIDMGFNKHDPNWAVAVKFSPEDAMTTILEIINTVGNTGEIFPKAILKPLELDGSEVTRAGLHNWGIVAQKKMYPGAKVIIAKAGDIIPQIYEVVTPSDNVVAPPSECPECLSPTRIELPHVYCTNENCPARICARIHDGIQVINTKGIGPETVKQLHKAGINCIEDLFDESKFGETVLIASGHFVKGRSLEKVLAAVDNIESMDLWQVIGCLKIEDVGKSLSKELAAYYSDTPSNFTGYTKITVAAMKDKASDEYNRVQNFLLTLEERGIKVKRPSSSGLIFEMTGTPPTIDGMKQKADYKSLLEDAGWTHGSIAKADVLITNSPESTTGKMAKAKAKGIKVLTYEQAVEGVK